MRFQKTRETAMRAADNCYLAGGLTGVFTASVFLKDTGSSLSATFGNWALGCLIAAPITLPCLAAGYTLDKVFHTKPVREKQRQALEAERQEARVAQGKVV